jgi:protease YdgD
MRALWAVAFFSALSLAAAPANAQGGALSDPRVRVDVHEPPWNAVGKLQALNGGMRTTCTATLVAPRTILSAAHCLYDSRTRRTFPASSLKFLVGLDGQRVAAGALVEKVAIGAGYDPDDPAGTMGSDWSLITLAAPITIDGRFPSLDPQPPAAGTPIMVGGYALDSPNILSADTRCRVTAAAVDSRRRGLILHDCAIVQGVSGAPLLRWTGREWTIVGINIGRSREGTRGFAVATEQVRPNP